MMLRAVFLFLIWKAENSHEIEKRRLWKNITKYPLERLRDKMLSCRGKLKFIAKSSYKTIYPRLLGYLGTVWIMNCNYNWVTSSASLIKLSNKTISFSFVKLLWLLILHFETIHSREYSLKMDFFNFLMLL